MARNRNHYIRGRAATTAVDSYWGPDDVVAWVNHVKAQDSGMVVCLYPTNYREALRAALEAAGMSWRYVEPGEIERMRAQRLADLKRLEAEQRSEWRLSCSAA